MLITKLRGAVLSGGDRGHDVDGVGSTAGVTYFWRATYPALRIVAASSSPSRAGANFLPDGVASRDHHAARSIWTLFPSSGSLANTHPNPGPYPALAPTVVPTFCTALGSVALPAPSSRPTSTRCQRRR